GPCRRDARAGCAKRSDRSVIRTRTSRQMPARCVMNGAWRASGIQRPLEVVHLFFRAIAIPPILFLQLASEILAVAGRYIEHVIGEIAPPGLRLALQLFPIA